MFGVNHFFYNPAGLDYVEGTEIFLGLTPITPNHSFRTDGYSLGAEGKTFLPPQIYAAKRVSKSLVLGLGVFAPFGLGTEWDTKWPGRYTSTVAEIQSVYINPTATFQLNDEVSIGVGVSYITSNAVIEKMVDSGLQIYGITASFDRTMMGLNPAHVPISNPGIIANTKYDSEFALDGDGSGFGYNVGVLLHPEEKVQIGISYRGASDIEYDGKAKFNHSSELVTIPSPAADGSSITVPASAALASKMPPEQNGTATLHLPWMLNFGIKYDITDTWDISGDFDIVGWSVYNELTIDFADDLPMDKQTMDKDWKSTQVFRLGSSYDVNETITIRGGALLDNTPIPDKTFDGQLPGSDRIGLSAGFGYKIGMIQLDASYMYLKFANRHKDNYVGYSDVTADGVVGYDDRVASNAMVAGDYPVGKGNYKSTANLFSLSASISF